MEYEVSLAPVDKMILNAQGSLEPLCNSCACPDCSNPIREKSVSQFGVIKKSRFYVVNNIVKQVVACRGYVGDSDAPQPTFGAQEFPAIEVEDGEASSESDGPSTD